jgi:cytochrome c biogenesis protein CcmG, thiol:disulfide interchange protein DsbE
VSEQIQTKPSPPKPSTRRGWKSALPLIAFLALAGLFVLRLQSGDHSALPSPLIGQPAPPFKLGPLAEGDRPGLSDADLRQGKTTVINFFASWCGPCRIEHPTLMKISANEALKAMGVRLVGVNYKDDPANALQLLAADGNPYAAIGADRNGRVGIDWGTTGVPETFIVRGDGTIAYKYTGPITEQAFKETVLPEIEKTLR